MEFDLMVGPTEWTTLADLARDIELAGFSGLVVTETSQPPWMAVASAANATRRLEFLTGIAVAFPRSPMVTAATAWDIAANTRGRFRLGLGSQVRAHVERRYGAEFDRPAARMADYVQAVRACFDAFARRAPLDHRGEFYSLSLLPPEWAPPAHTYDVIPIDISAVGPRMLAVAGELADGVHVHPLHSREYLAQRLLRDLDVGLAKADRVFDDVDLIVPVFAVPGDSREEQRELLEMARLQVGFYGSTAAYAFQFDDLGFDGLSARLNDRLKAGDVAGMLRLVTDDVLSHFAVLAPWDGLADALIERYDGIASRLVAYLGAGSMLDDPREVDRWGEIARAVRAA